MIFQQGKILLFILTFCIVCLSGASLKSEEYYLYDFTASWCRPCQLMDLYIWPDEDVRNKISKFDGIWEFDWDNHPPEENAYFTGYNITSVPTIIIVDSKGNEIKRSEKYMNKSQMLKFLSGVVDDKKQSDTIHSK